MQAHPSYRQRNSKIQMPSSISLQPALDSDIKVRDYVKKSASIFHKLTLRLERLLLGTVFATEEAGPTNGTDLRAAPGILLSAKSKWKRSSSNLISKKWYASPSSIVIGILSDAAWKLPKYAGHGGDGPGGPGNGPRSPPPGPA